MQPAGIEDLHVASPSVCGCSSSAVRDHPFSGPTIDFDATLTDTAAGHLPAGAIILAVGPHEPVAGRNVPAAPPRDESGPPGDAITHPTTKCS